jgi:hypothetical protein
MWFLTFDLKDKTLPGQQLEPKLTLSYYFANKNMKFFNHRIIERKISLAASY